MDRYTDPSDQWTDEQTNRQISGRDVIDINMDYTMQCWNLFFFINIKDMNLYIMIDLNSFIIMHLPFEKLFILSTNRVSVKKNTTKYIFFLYTPPPQSKPLSNNICISVICEGKWCSKRGYCYISFLFIFELTIYWNNCMRGEGGKRFQ